MSHSEIDVTHAAQEVVRPLVQLEALKVYFSVRKGLFRTREIRAVDDVTLSVARGETVSLVGESGSGKTTLGRASLRLVRPTAGRVIFDGTDITHVREERLKDFRRRAQAVFQDPYSSIDPYMSVFQTVEEPLLIHGLGGTQERAEAVAQALRDVKLEPAEEFEPRYPHVLSGGQRQRVGLARALVLRPQYIVADEAVSMIDASSRAEILSLLRELQARYQLTFLYITHDIATARHFGRQVAVMYLGTVVEQGPVSTVVEAPLHPYTQALLQAVPEPDPANRFRQRPVVPGAPPSPVDVPSGCPFHPRCPSFMKGTCDVVRPSLIKQGAGRSVACHLYTDNDVPSS